MDRRILITGSREWSDRETLRRAILAEMVGHSFHSVVIIHGACPRGADRIADDLASQMGLRVERHPADWKRHGKRSGILRNQEMVDLGAAVCLAFPTASSVGTLHCMGAAEKGGIIVKSFMPES